MTDKVAIVGAGLVGRAWAISFARGGHRVMIFDADDKAVASALSTVEGMLRTLELKGMLKGQTAADVRSRMTGGGSLEIALAGAAHVQENVPEDLGGLTSAGAIPGMMRRRKPTQTQITRPGI